MLRSRCFVTPPESNGWSQQQSVPADDPTDGWAQWTALLVSLGPLLGLQLEGDGDSFIH